MKAMKLEPEGTKQEFRPALRLAIVILAAWTILIGSSLTWNMYDENRQTIELAGNEARANFNKDKAFRLWVASHGGVYVPSTERTPPNPRLAHIPERDIETPSGKKLTLMNPAYVVRQMMNDFADLYGIKGRITSFPDKLFYPGNAPDDWELMALNAFKEGKTEVKEIASINGEPHLRLMRPYIIEKPCLKCHGIQGYKVGDLRGGVSLALPMTPYLAIQKRQDVIHAATHGIIWLIGVSAIGLIARQSRRRAMERLLTYEALRSKSLKLEQTNEELKQIADAAAHDLQEPLRTVVGHSQFLQSLRNRSGNPLDEEANRTIGFITDAVRMMRAKIADIQDYLQISEDHPLAMVDANVLVIKVLEEMKAGIAERGAAVNCLPLPKLAADGKRLALVFSHLIGNALKYCKQGVAPKVDISAKEMDGEWVFSVADNGIGIAPEYQDQIFGLFKRLHAQEKYQGTGMGLAICKKIVEQGGGRVWVESQPGEGSRFFFTIPKKLI